MGTQWDCTLWCACKIATSDTVTATTTTTTTITTTTADSNNNHTGLPAAARSPRQCKHHAPTTTTTDNNSYAHLPAAPPRAGRHHSAHELPAAARRSRGGQGQKPEPEGSEERESGSRKDLRKAGCALQQAVEVRDKGSGGGVGAMCWHSLGFSGRWRGHVVAPATVAGNSAAAWNPLAVGSPGAAASVAAMAGPAPYVLQLHGGRPSGVRRPSPGAPSGPSACTHMYRE
eukprot:1157568-Pelagomonas_calceolata.AAC.5